MPYCTNCGKEIPAGSTFCGQCGAKAPESRTISKESLPRFPAPSATAAPSRTPTGSLVDRMIRAMRLDVSLYEEVERDEGAMNQAITVVIISSLCAGVGSLISSLSRGGGGFGLIGAFAGVIVSLIGWFIWSFTTYIIGTRIIKGQETQATYGELLRTIGFSRSPGVFNALGFLPLASFIVGIWELAAMIIAVRQALDFTTMKAVLTCIVGWIANVLVYILIGGLLALPTLL